MYSGKYYDFHIHTNYSDGKLSPEEVVKLAIKNDLNTIAITDHYTLAGYDSARIFQKKFQELNTDRKLNIIPGMEFSAQNFSRNKKLHIIGLYVNKSIYSIVDLYEKNRKILVEQILARFKKEHRWRIKVEDIAFYARDKLSVGRYDIAIALYQMQYASSVEKAYEEILMSTEIYVPRDKLLPEEIIDVIKKTGGVSILAHPNSCKYSIGSMIFEKNIEELAMNGLNGIEVYTPYISEFKQEELLKICEKYNLIASVGSDCHCNLIKYPIIGLGLNNNLCVSSPNLLRQIKKVRGK